MAEKVIKQGSPEHQTFVDFWALYKKYGVPEDNEEYWQELVTASEQFYVDHGSTLLAKRLAQVLGDVVEEDFKKKNKRG